MARPASEHPTGLELQILKFLWEKAPLKVREVRAALAEGGRPLAHTSVITTLNIMVDKGYLRRKPAGKLLLFSPRVSRTSVSKKMLGDVVNRVFDGSASAVIGSDAGGSTEPHVAALAATGKRPSQLRQRILRLLSGDAEGVRLTQRGAVALTPLAMGKPAAKYSS